MLLLHLVGCLYYCINDALSHKHQIEQYWSFAIYLPIMKNFVLPTDYTSSCHHFLVFLLPVYELSVIKWSYFLHFNSFLLQFCYPVKFQCNILTRTSVNIQGDSGEICTTLVYDSMSDSKQKSSYEHGSDFERLRSYERLKLGIESNDYWQWTEENNKPA